MLARLLGVFVLLSFVPVLAEDAPVNRGYVIDADRLQLVVFDLDTGTETKTLPLGTHHEATDVVLSTLSGEPERFVFVAMGPYLRIFDNKRLSPTQTVFLGNELGIGRAFRAHSLAAANNLLYVAGHRGAYPYVLVLDQEKLVAGDLEQALLYDVAPCGSQCDGRSVAVAATPLGPYAEEEAWLTTFETAPSAMQRFYNLRRQEDGSFTLTPGYEEQAFETPVSAGISYDASGVLATGVLPESGRTVELFLPTLGCPLNGTPTDSVMWGPSGGYRQFATYEDATGAHLAVRDRNNCTLPPEVYGLGAKARDLELTSLVDHQGWAFIVDGEASELRRFQWEIGEAPTYTVTMAEQDALTLYGGCGGGHDPDEIKPRPVALALGTLGTETFADQAAFSCPPTPVTPVCLDCLDPADECADQPGCGDGDEDAGDGGPTHLSDF